MIRSKRSWPSYLALGLWSFFVLVPLWVMIINSFKPRLSIYEAPMGLPETWTLEGYVSIFTGSQFPLYFLNSFAVVGGSIAFILFFASLAAYAIVNWNVPFTRAMTVFFIAGMMIPIRIGSVNLLQIARDLGLLDKAFGLVPVYVAMGMPIGVFVLVEFIRGVPKDLVSCTIYVIDKAAYRAATKQIGESWRRQVGRHYPAMALLVVSALLEDEAQVEIEATAVI